jgi:hypothetical protein
MILVGSQNEGYNYEDQDVGGWIILILTWSGLIWLRIETSGRF